MKNITITLDENVAKWARIRAAELDTSLSRLVGELLREKMLAGNTYDRAREDYLSRGPVRMRKTARPYLQRGCIPSQTM
jgi:hypothetical protein